MWSCRNFCLLCLNACGALVKHCGLALELGDTGDMLMCITKMFVAWMPKSSVPQQLFSARSNCANWHQLVNDELEALNVDSFQLIRHGSKRVIELLMLCSLDDGHFCVDSMLAHINEQGVLCLSKIE